METLSREGMDTSSSESRDTVCYDGNLFELVRRLLHRVPEDALVPDELVYAMRSARVRVEGDCSILEEIAQHLKENARSSKPGVEDVLEALLKAIAAEAVRCSAGVLWGEVAIELDYGGGRRLSIRASGVPVETVLSVKAVCGQR